MDNTKVARLRGVQLEPDYTRILTDQTAVTYTHTLTNASNYTETISLSKQHTEEWLESLTPDDSVELGPWATDSVIFNLEIPPDSGGVTDIATITATLGSVISARAVDTTTVQSNYAFELLPLAQSSLAGPSEVVTFTHFLTNTGNIADAFNLEVANDQGGWANPVLSEETIALSPGGSQEIVITVTVPSGAYLGQVNETTLTVSSTSTGESQSAVDTITVEIPVIRTVAIGLPASSSAYPEETVTYHHQITNTGNISDSYSLTAASQLGWSGLTVEPTEVTLTAGESHPFTVTFTVPASAEAGLLEHTTVTATSQSDSNVSATLVDTTTVSLVSSFTFTADQAAEALPGESLVYTHTLENLGNAEELFDLTANSSLSWTVAVSPQSTVTLAAGGTAQVAVTVTVPSDAAAGLLDTTVVTATSQSEGAQAQVTDETTVLAVPAVEIAPPHEDSALPGSSVVYTHTLINSGNATDDFRSDRAFKSRLAGGGAANLQHSGGWRAQHRDRDASSTRRGA